MLAKKYSWTLKFSSGSYSTNRPVERQKCCYHGGYGHVVFMFSTQTCMYCSSSVEIFSHSCLKMWLKCRWVQTHIVCSMSLCSFVWGIYASHKQEWAFLCSLLFSSHCPPFESSFSWNPVSICGPALLFHPKHCPTSQKEPIIHS